MHEKIIHTPKICFEL